MAGILQTQPVDTDNAQVAMLSLAWEMTKLVVYLDPTHTTGDKLREEFAKNIDAIHNAWSTRGDGTADQVKSKPSPFT